jgi:signal transduction histidine kinase
VLDESRIVMGPDGTVLAATRDLPAGLIDGRLEDCSGLPSEVREAGKALLDRLQRSRDRALSQRVPVDGGRQHVELLAIEVLAVRRAATNLRTLLASKLAVLSSQALAAGVTLSVVVADDVPATVQLDSEKIAWAVTTLVGNALRYVQSGRQRTTGGTIAVRVVFEPAESRVAIEVRDNGPGIPAESVARLFKRDGLNVLGSGLSLLLMSDICAAQGGRVEVTSRTQGADHGTTVRLSFPHLT